MRPLPVLLLVALLAGCAAPPPSTDPPPGDDGSTTTPPSGVGTPPPSPGDPTPAGPRLDGPTWSLGDAWTYTLRLGNREVTHELVVFRADGEHWWLGLENRTLALEHALRDTNPLVGRIHYGILSPHESGRHAGMYSFPLEDGKGWSGDLFGGVWQFVARWDAADSRYRITGAGVNQSRLELDYEPDVQWFSALRVTGTEEPLELLLQDHRRGATGTFHFFRGVDLYAGPGPLGPTGGAVHVDEVVVEDGFDGLGVSLRATASAPAVVTVLDPGNQERFRRVLQPGEAVDELVELPHAPGTWRVVYTGLANLDAEVRLAGLEAHVEPV